MSPEERQAELDNISPADLEKIQARTKSKGYKVETEDIIEAEFLMKFGWEAYWDLHPDKKRSNGIDGNEMVRLLTAGRKVDAQDMYKDAQSMFIASASAQSRKPSSTFTSLTTKLVKHGEADK